MTSSSTLSLLALALSPATTRVPFTPASLAAIPLSCPAASAAAAAYLRAPVSVSSSSSSSSSSSAAAAALPPPPPPPPSSCAAAATVSTTTSTALAAAAASSSDSSASRAWRSYAPRGFDATIETSFCQLRGCGDGRRLLFLHGADSNALEWRHLIGDLAQKGHSCTALDWWSGGWTDRAAITRALEAQPTPPRPWELVRAHAMSFLEQHMDDGPVVLVGTSLGGAVALDLAASHPEAFEALVLIDAGGQSYKAPAPDVVTALAPIALTVKRIAAYLQKRSPDEAVRLVAAHRDEPGWLEAGEQYLRSGSYARAVGPDLIRTVQPRTLVIWGERDPILPLSDAYAFERDLPNCAGVRVIPGAGHSPHLEDPRPVIDHLHEFLDSLP
eukprot:scaffold200065_cov34-Tisochrysis_lutea.AAC.1